jgi:AcrR family transcriptional regulator
MGALKSARSEGAAATVDMLLSVAERLFAQKGVEHVALNQIVTASSQRNRSALHYHFGSRGGMLTAVLDRRLAPINARRLALLDALPPSPTSLQILRATTAPLGLIAFEEPWGPDYISILAQVTFHPQLLGELTLENANLSGLRRTQRLLTQAIPQLPADLLMQRLRWFTDSVVFTLARWMRDTHLASRSPAAMGDLMEQLVAYGAAGLTAPDPSTPTQDLAP